MHFPSAQCSASEGGREIQPKHPSEQSELRNSRRENRIDGGKRRKIQPENEKNINRTYIFSEPFESKFALTWPFFIPK